jgi:hypothetical protein
MNTELQVRAIEIRTEFDLEKVVAFLRVNARHVDFLVDRRLTDLLIGRLAEFAEENGRLTVELVAEDGELILTCGLTGAALGAVIGLAVAGAPGAVVGGVAGGVTGVLVGGLRVRIDTGRHPGGDLLVAIS